MRPEKIGQSAYKIRVLAGLLFVVCLTVLVVHWPALSAQALSIDDQQYLADNVLVRNPGWASAKRFLTEILEPSTVRGYYQPLTMISLMFDYGLGGRPDNLRPFHRTSLALHVANTGLIIVLLYLLFGQVWAAAAMGLLFGVHPMTVEPIPWVGERKTLLAAFFALWSLILYVRFTRRKNWGTYVGCFVMYLLALMSKPTSTPLPALMLLLDYWPLKRLKMRTVLEKLPFFVLGGVFAVITYISQGRTAGTLPLAESGPVRILLILCHNIIFYLYKIVLPVNLSSHYGWPEPLGLSNPMVLAGVIGTCILIPLLVISLRWTRAALIGWLIFFVAILPAMQVISFSNVIASDKFAYLPSVGLLMILVSFLCWLRRIGKRGLKYTAIAIIIVLAAAEAIATQRYLAYWRNSISLYGYMLTLKPNAALIHNNLANALQSQGKFGEAISHYRQALQTKPNSVEANNNLGTLLGRQGKLTEAIRCFRRAVQLMPNFAKAHSNLGYALKLQGKLDKATEHYRQALKFNPDFAEAHNNFGYLLLAKGEFDEAISHFRRAHKLEPNWPWPLNGIAQILATHPNKELRDAGQAIELAKRAAELTRYRNATMLNTLATAYAAAGQFDQAVKTARAALWLSSAARDKSLSDRIRKQLEIYRQAKP